MPKTIEEWAKDKGAGAYRTFNGPLWPGQTSQYQFIEMLQPNPPGWMFSQWMRKAGEDQPFVVVDGSSAYMTMQEGNRWIEGLGATIVQ